MLEGMEYWETSLNSIQIHSVSLVADGKPQEEFKHVSPSMVSQASLIANWHFSRFWHSKSATCPTGDIVVVPSQKFVADYLSPSTTMSIRPSNFLRQTTFQNNLFNSSFRWNASIVFDSCLINLIIWFAICLLPKCLLHLVLYLLCISRLSLPSRKPFLKKFANFAHDRPFASFSFHSISHLSDGKSRVCRRNQSVRKSLIMHNEFQPSQANLVTKTFQNYELLNFFKQQSRNVCSLLDSIWPNHNISSTYIDFPEIRGFPFLNYLLGWGRVRSL